MNRTTPHPPIPEAAGMSREMASRLACFLAPLLSALDERLDVRLVRTLAATVVNLIRHRDRALSLVLTELGELLTDGAHAPAGVKRLWRLLHSPAWAAAQIDAWLLERADEAVERTRARDGVAYAVLDGSVVEKPEARQLEGLMRVRSAAAARLRRACGGPPAKPPTIVPGFGWVAVVLTGLAGSLTLARLAWYSPSAPGEAAQRQREAERGIVTPLVERWAQRVIWLVDRGLGNGRFLGEAFAPARFIARWRKDYHLHDLTTGTVQGASALTRHQRSAWTTQVTDPQTSQFRTLGVASRPVTLPGDSRPLWLVVARRRGTKESLWLLTTEDASTRAGALGVVWAYARRWQVEWAFRFGKSELGVGSVRVASWAYRAKLWRLAALVHAFLLALLVVLDEAARARLLRWCHRTGRRAREAIAPLYRLRHALANLWNAHLPTLAWFP